MRMHQPSGAFTMHEDGELDVRCAAGAAGWPGAVSEAGRANDFGRRDDASTLGLCLLLPPFLPSPAERTVPLAPPPSAGWTSAPFSPRRPSGLQRACCAAPAGWQGRRAAFTCHARQPALTLLSALSSRYGLFCPQVPDVRGRHLGRAWNRGARWIRLLRAGGAASAGRHIHV